MRKYGTYCQLGFSSETKVAQLGSDRLGTFIARLGTSWQIPARAHHFLFIKSHLNTTYLVLVAVQMKC